MVEWLNDTVAVLRKLYLEGQCTAPCEVGWMMTPPVPHTHWGPTEVTCLEKGPWACDTVTDLRGGYLRSFRQTKSHDEQL